MTTPIALLGFGYLGSFVYREITAHPEWGLEVVAVVTRSAEAPVGLPRELHRTHIDGALSAAPRLVVELADASLSREHGAAILQGASYMPFSLSALADAALHTDMLDAAAAAGTTLYIPHGAATGLDTLSECRDIWEEVTVTMKKNPANLDFSAAAHLRPAEGATESILFDGPTRDICPLFPRNVNTHAAVALAGIGFDRTRSVLVADPALSESVIEVEARGQGVELLVERRNPLKGVSGILTQRSALGCIRRACGGSSVELV